MRSRQNDWTFPEVLIYSPNEILSNRIVTTFVINPHNAMEKQPPDPLDFETWNHLI